MSIKKILTPAAVCRIATIILGLVVLGLGLYSHFDSSWAISYVLTSEGYKRAYKICDLPEFDKCPGLNFERYFVATTIFCFVLSIFGLVADLLFNASRILLKYIDTVYHALAAILIVIAGVLYIISTEQINDIVVSKDYTDAYYFRRTEKLVAGSLAIIQGLLYGLTAFFIGRQPVNKDI